jgi:membrane associated rhomboid family serine protease
MIIGFMLESVLGPIRVAILYMAAGYFELFFNNKYRIGGNLFSSLCAYNETAVGASTAIFGLLSALVLTNQDL